MNLMRIAYFVEVARCENMTEAARKLYTSQPNLSKQISMMEQELGFPLFQRAGKTIYLTQAGEYLYEKFRELPEYTAQAIAHAKALSRGDVGTLAVGILEGQDVNNWLTERLGKLHQSCPDLTLDMERNSFKNLRRGLEHFKYDLIITLSFETVDHDQWQSETLIRQNGVIAISRNHPLAEKADLNLCDLREEQFVAISPEESPGGYAQLFNQCAECGFQPKISRVASTLESLLLCVETGIGVALLDLNTRLRGNENVRIVPLPKSAYADVVAVWGRDNRNPAIQRLVAELKQ